MAIPEIYLNDPGTTLGAAITSTSATTITVSSSAGYPSGATLFRIGIDNELMFVTNISGTTWTVIRGIEGTSAATHSNSAAVNALLSSASLIRAIQQYSIACAVPILPPSAAMFGTWINQGSSSIADCAGGLGTKMISQQENGGVFASLRVKSRATSAPYCAEWGFVPFLHNAGYVRGGGYVANSGSGILRGALIQTDGTNFVASVRPYNSPTSQAASIESFAPSTANGVPVFSRMTDDGTNTTYLISMDLGRSWVQLAQDTFSFDQVGLGVDPAFASITINGIAEITYFHFAEYPTTTP